jgi:acyl-CoA synthetase (AMP-forming)/AMP-acid ligase II
MYSHPLNAFVQARFKKLAFACEDYLLTGESFGILVKHLAKIFKHAGVKYNDKIGICLPYDGDWVLAFWALNLLGAVVVPIKFSSTTKELEALQTLFDLKMGIGNRFKEINLPCIVDSMDQLLDQSAQDDLRKHPFCLVDILQNPQSLAFYLGDVYQLTIQKRLNTQSTIKTIKDVKEYPWGWERKLILLSTSGTTGTPKLVPIKARQIIMNAFGSAIRIGHLPNDCWLACLPFHHIGGLSILLRSMLYQVPIMLYDFHVPHLHLLCQQGLITQISLTPTMLDQWVQSIAQNQQEQTLPYPNLRTILIGGAPTSQQLWETAIALGLPIYLTWGMSEAASQVCTQIDQMPPDQPIPPLPFVQVDLEKTPAFGFERIDLTDIHQSLPSHKNEPTGRLLIKSPTTLMGELKTDDMGQVSKSGVIVLGRADDVILSGGVNIHPQEIENVLMNSSLVEEVAITKFKDSRWGERPVAFVVLKQHDVSFEFDRYGKAIFDHQRSIEQGKIFAQELTRHCKKILSPYKAPAHYIFVNHLPKGQLGKISRKGLISAFDCEKLLLQEMMSASSTAHQIQQTQQLVSTNLYPTTLETPMILADQSPTQPLFFEQIDITYDADPQQDTQTAQQDAQTAQQERQDTAQHVDIPFSKPAKDQKTDKG